jgi:AraC family transcriptional regulator
MRSLERTSFVPPLRRRDVGGISVSTSAYAGSSVIPLHEHKQPYLCLVAEGGYRQSSRGREDDCRRGLLLVHPQGHRHSNRFHPHGARSLDVFLSADWLEDSGTLRLLSDYRQVRLPGAEALIVRLERELRAGDEAAGVALQSAVLEVIAQAIRLEEAPGRPAWMARVLERLRDEPASTAPLLELAALAGVHPAHLARTFRRLQGLSVGEYQRNLRVTLACRGLRDPARSIAQVAAEAGFCDQSHFARVFRRAIGQTPGEYRRLMQIPSR